MAALEHSSAQNLGLAERPLCRRPPDRFGSIGAGQVRAIRWSVACDFTRGDSMEDAGLFEGDIVAVQKGAPAKPDDNLCP